GWKVSEVWLLDRLSGDLRPVLRRELEALFQEPRWVGGRIVTTTSRGAPKFRVVAVDPDRAAPAHWETLVPEGGWPIDAAVVAGDHLGVVRNVKAVSRLEIHSVKGKLLHEVDLPGPGSVFGLDAEPEGDRFFFAYSTFFEPTALYEAGAADGRARPVRKVAGAPDSSDYVVDQVEYPSYDGTWVPMFLLHRRGLKRDGSHPTVLTGYGGFGISETPDYSTMGLFWLERGGVFAVANLRGGGERGEAWHDAGRLGRKHQVFRDFEYAMRYLVRSGVTRPRKLAIVGGSNGGLLMGAMMTQAPELFRVCVGKVGLYDMVRYHRFPPAEWWVDEYGSADDPGQVGYLLGYSPYHQVVDGVSYPAFLGTTAVKDTRVSWIHTAKFVARLQQATRGNAPILFFREERAGHGAGKGKSARLREDVMTWQFILSQLGLLPAGRRDGA
ncbi:MAG: prolyl oligopeptidase family serine peptidase, partial [Planctomycetota bacterium]